MLINEEIQKKWGPVLEHPDLPSIKDSHKRSTIAQLLENTEAAMREAGQYAPQSLLETNGPSTNLAGGALNYDPVLISLVRRAMPNLIAYDICGVQPMTGPTGLIFALRPQYTSQSGNDAFYNEANTGHTTINAGNNSLGQSGNNVGTVPAATNAAYNFASGMSTAQAEMLGTTSNSEFAQMAFSIDKVTVTAKSRALKAEYSIELAQDLKAIHGLDAETELSSILSAEILAEINREVVRTIGLTASSGATDTTSAGTFDLDVD